MSLWQMSLQGGVMILLAAALRVPLKRRLPKWTFPALWALALARLLLPIALPLPRAVNELLFRAQSAASTPGQAAQTASLSAANRAWKGAAPAALEGTMGGGLAGQGPIGQAPWLWLWAAGALALAVYFAVAYWRGYRLFAASLPVGRPEVARWQSAHPLHRPYAIRESDRVSTPLTYGVLRPVILLPKSARKADEQTLNALLTHEWTHIRRFDAAFKLALAAALCLHWPNPAVWLLYTLANRDLEFACDDAALARLGANRRASYARALLCMEALRDGSLPFCSGFGKSDIEERIRSIMKTKKASPWAVALALAVLLASVTAFAAPNPSIPYDVTLMETDAGDLYTLVDSETGRVYYHDEEGNIWKELTPEQAEKLFPPHTIEWWTANEYSEWLENEKKELESIIGTRAWTRSDGWFTWTREKVDETIAMYEQTLKDIQNGLLISKTIDGSDDIVLAQGGAEAVSATTSVVIASTDQEDIAPTEDVATTVVVDPGTAVDSVTMEMEAETTLVADQSDGEEPHTTLDDQFSKYGLTYQDGVLTWKGERVSRFVDFAPDGGVFTYSDDTYHDGLSLYTVYGPDGTLTAVMPF